MMQVPLLERFILSFAALCVALQISPHAFGQDSVTKAFIDGTGPGWRSLGEEDFVNVNCDPETWTWDNGLAKCTGRPVGVIRSVKPITNFELVVQWRHLRSGGNSGVFLWGTEESLAALKPGDLPQGIEVQVLGDLLSGHPVTAQLGEQIQLDSRQERLRRPEPHPDLHDV